MISVHPIKIILSLSLMISCSSAGVIERECDVNERKLENTFVLGSTNGRTLVNARFNMITIPPFTKVIATINAYCANARKAGPSYNEQIGILEVSDDDPIREYLNNTGDRHYSRRRVQTDIWNLSSGERRNSEPRQRRSENLRLIPFIPVEDTIFKVNDLVVYTLENFHKTEREILRRRSRYRLSPEVIRNCHYPFVITVERLWSFRKAKVSIYNFTGSPRDCYLSDFRLVPYRKDVQPLVLKLQ